jgi:hypothetical protein
VRYRGSVLRRAVVSFSLAVLTIACGSKSQLRAGALAPEVDAAVDAAHVMDGGHDDARVVDASDAALDDAADGADATLSDAARGDAAREDAAIAPDAAAPTIGCADGEREGYRDLPRYPDIAACAGGWDHPGVAHASPAFCDHGAGDDGASPAGVGCGVADFCEPGFHVCLGPSDVDRSSPDGCAGSHDAPSSFFVTRMSSSGCGVCATGTSTTCSAIDCRMDCAQTSATTNDVFGCGTLGDVPSASTCGVLDRFSNNLCSALGDPWSCEDDGSGTHEAELLLKSNAAHGGVLCCRD